MSEKTTSKEEDSLLRLKYIGYCMSQLPPETENVTYEDFLQFAKFQLCMVSGKLMKDPIWDTYTTEEIFVEYYALLYHKSKEEKEKFELELQGETTDIVDEMNDWFDKMIAENQKELEVKAEKLEDHVSFSPKSLGE